MHRFPEGSWSARRTGPKLEVDQACRRKISDVEEKGFGWVIKKREEVRAGMRRARPTVQKAQVRKKEANSQR